MAKNEVEGAATAAAQTHQNHPSPEQARHPDAPAPVAPKPPERPIPKPIGERYFSMKESKQTEWFALVNADVHPDDCLRREFWSQIVPKVAYGSRIIVFPENRAWYGELIVFGMGIGWVEARWAVGPIKAPSSTLNYTAASDYEVKELGEIKRWGVVRRSDGQVSHSGEVSQEAASRWLAEFIRGQMARAA